MTKLANYARAKLENIAKKIVKIARNKTSY